MYTCTKPPHSLAPLNVGHCGPKRLNMHLQLPIPRGFGLGGGPRNVQAAEPEENAPLEVCLFPLAGGRKGLLSRGHVEWLRVVTDDDHM